MEGETERAEVVGSSKANKAERGEEEEEWRDDKKNMG